MAETEILEGTLLDLDESESPAALWVDLTLSRNGRALHEAHHYPIVLIRLDDGTVIPAEQAAEVRLVPTRELTGTPEELLEKLRDHPLIEEVLDHAPGHRTTMQLACASLIGGERVAVRGRVTYGPSEGSYRDAPRVPEKVQIELASTGPDPRAQLERALSNAAQEARSVAKASRDAVEAKERAAERAARVEAGDTAEPLAIAPAFGLAALGALAWVLGAFTTTAPGWPLAPIGAATLAIAVLVYRRRRWMPDLVSSSEGARLSSYRWHVRRWLLVMLGLIALFTVAGALAPADSANGADQLIRSIGPYLFATVPVLALVVLFVSDQASASRAFGMLRAPRLDSSSKSGAFGALEGRLKANIARVTRYRSHSSTEKEMRTDASGNIYESSTQSVSVSGTRVGPEGAVVVDGDRGAVSVMLADAVYGVDTPTVQRGSGDPNGDFASLFERGDEGSEALVVGRFAEESGALSFEAGGSDLLFVFVAPRAPRARLARHLALHYASLLTLAGLTAAVVLAAQP